MFPSLRFSYYTGRHGKHCKRQLRTFSQHRPSLNDISKRYNVCRRVPIIRRYRVPVNCRYKLFDKPSKIIFLCIYIILYPFYVRGH